MDLSWFENILIGVLVFAIILAVDRIPAFAGLTRGVKALIVAIAAMVAVVLVDMLV